MVVGATRDELGWECSLTLNFTCFTISEIFQNAVCRFYGEPGMRGSKNTSTLAEWGLLAVNGAPPDEIPDHQKRAIFNAME